VVDVDGLPLGAIFFSPRMVGEDSSIFNRELIVIGLNPIDG